MQYSEEIFGANGVNSLKNISPLLTSSNEFEYHFLLPDEHKELLERNTEEGLQQYWKEIIYRSHFSAVVSINRNFEWIQGMQNCYDCGLLLPFASCMRSWLESVADTFYSLNIVPLALAEEHKKINNILSGIENPEGIFLAPQLEENLIHFSHARRIGRDEEAPDNHRNKSARSYIDSVDKTGEYGLHELYSELCEYTHPASTGVTSYIENVDANNFKFSSEKRREKIVILANKYSKCLPVLISGGLNLGIVTLKVLHHIELPSCHMKEANDVSVDNVNLWRTCCGYFHNSVPKKVERT